MLYMLQQRIQVQNQVEEVGKAFASDGYCVNCLIQCGFFIGFLNLSARHRLGNVFYVPQNVPKNES